MKLLNKVKISLLIFVGIIISLSINAFAVTGTITQITVNMRKEPSTDSKKLMYVTQDDKVEVLEKNGEWYKIKFKGVIGYVFGEYLKVDDTKLEQKEETVEEKTKVESEEIDSTITEETKQNANTNLIIKDQTQIRIIPNISSSVIYTAKKDIKIDIIEQLKNWSYISVDGINGWVRTDKIVEENEVLPDEKKTDKKEETTQKEDKAVETTKKETKTAYIKYDRVNLRKKASTTSTVLSKLKINDKVTVIEEVNSEWSKVEVDGITGYISTELLSDKKQEEKKTEKVENETTSRDGETTTREETTTNKKEESISNKVETTKKEEDVTSKKEENKEIVSNKITGEDIVAYAKQYLGYNYVLGGSSPKTGFDCSGFTKYIYNHFGYKISRSSKTQIKDGKAVAKSDLKPGDLLIFKNQSLTAIGHVGIYIGNNKMIHASEPGVGVVITDLDAKGYNYNKRYVAARRIIE